MQVTQTEHLSHLLLDLMKRTVTGPFAGDQNSGSVKVPTPGSDQGHLLFVDLRHHLLDLGHLLVGSGHPLPYLSCLLQDQNHMDV